MTFREKNPKLEVFLRTILQNANIRPERTAITVNTFLTSNIVINFPRITYDFGMIRQRIESEQNVVIQKILRRGAKDIVSHTLHTLTHEEYNRLIEMRQKFNAQIPPSNIPFEKSDDYLRFLKEALWWRYTCGRSKEKDIHCYRHFSEFTPAEFLKNKKRQQGAVNFTSKLEEEYRHLWSELIR